MTIKNKIKQSVVKVAPQRSAPIDPKDILIKAVKTAISYAITAYPLNAILDMNIDSLKLLAINAGVAGGTVIINAVQLWAQSE